MDEEKLIPRGVKEGAPPTIPPVERGVQGERAAIVMYKGAAIKKAYGFLPPWTKKN